MRIREIEVYVDECLVFTGSIGNSCGVIVPLEPSASPSPNIVVPIDEAPAITDPALECNTVEFVVRATMDPTGHEFGLRMIRMYNRDGRLATIDSRVTYRLENCGDCLGPRFLFSDVSEIGDENLLFSVWKGEIGEEQPKLAIIFASLHRFAAIEIVNPNVADKRVGRIAVTAGSVNLDGRNVWAGKLAVKTGDETSRLGRTNSTFVWLVGDRNVKEKISRTATPAGPHPPAVRKDAPTDT
jgi:hypothetical protein